MEKNSLGARRGGGARCYNDGNFASGSVPGSVHMGNVGSYGRVSRTHRPAGENMSRRSSRHRTKKRFSRLNQPTRLTRNSSGRRMWFEMLEDRILLTRDLGTNLQAVIKAGAANAGALVDAIHDNIFDHVLQNSQPLIGAALQVKDSANDKLNALSSNVQSQIAQLANQAKSNLAMSPMHFKMPSTWRSGRRQRSRSLPRSRVSTRK